MTNKNFYEGKKVFITGADGFIGSHLAEMLVYAGANVRGLIYYNSWNSHGCLDDISTQAQNSIEKFYGDIRDSERISEGIRGCDYVFHLSSLISIPYSYDAARSYVDVNILGALNVLNACRANSSLERLLHVSTSEVYGSAQQVPIPESHPLVGQSPYAASKIAADKLVESFHLSFGLPMVIARPFNTFGPRQTARAVIPTIISQLLGGCSELRLGSITPTRDFNFVTDTARGMMALAACQAADGIAVNIGSGEEWSISEAIEVVFELLGYKVPVVVEESKIRPKKSEVNRLLADNSLIGRLTDWKSEISFKEGLKLTADWIEKNILGTTEENYD